MPTLALLLVFLLCRRACSRCRCSACRHLRDWLRTCPCALGLAVVVPLLSRCRLGHVDWWYFTLLCCQSNSPKSFHPQSSNPPPLFDNIFCQSNLLKPVHPQSSNLPPLFDNILCHQGKFLALLILFPSPPIRMLAFFAGLSSLGMESFVVDLSLAPERFLFPLTLTAFDPSFSIYPRQDLVPPRLLLRYTQSFISRVIELQLPSNLSTRVHKLSSHFRQV
ncbi:uncharacterized protein BKA78DRAFT_308373 [Phyllosticta capitalensis]|uniref:uncharacterized protein n=1 Tax=Phyllosticta capitalensis TaxID=121624 RepID=UPI00312F91B9